MFFYLNKKDYTEDLITYTRLSQNYTATLNNRMTLIGNSITGIGFIPVSYTHLPSGIP